MLRQVMRLEQSTMYHHQKFHEYAAEDRSRHVDYFTLISECKNRARAIAKQRSLEEIVGVITFDY